MCKALLTKRNFNFFNAKTKKTYFKKLLTGFNYQAFLLFSIYSLILLSAKIILHLHISSCRYVKMLFPVYFFQI